MKLARFLYKKKPEWGIIEGDSVIILKGKPYSGIKRSSMRIPLGAVRLLVPAEPSKIVLVGLNYRDHAAELGMKIPKEPVIFMKPTTSLVANGENIIYPKGVSRVDYEAELALVIKKKGRNIPANEAAGYILGYTCLNDVTARLIQRRDVQWTRAKSYDTFCPLGPHLETSINTKNLRVRCKVNGKIKQDCTTSGFIFDPFKLVSFISNVMTLHPGDIISTGTPSGVGPVKVGERVSVHIEGIGRLTNKVVGGR
ncbi:MAG: fumarylacetoacetate hydrolase family protein [bacterium]